MSEEIFFIHFLIHFHRLAWIERVIDGEPMFHKKHKISPFEEPTHEKYMASAILAKCGAGLCADLQREIRDGLALFENRKPDIM